ncbi:autotransporter outer membrane beta-barrel domain-containing protein [Sphingopyxis sp. PET50]|uniref:autotransporter outer membrane beta-barrel domain-containing protein n=1 Tax=Sphingopyxis sp. PET50 TaxID=2976533 RepID=UPI0021AFA4FC|nr:autotransporter outer membrane beta-barrel domain-containing protein [Sphingopyxis sp. PET50]
MVTTNRITLNSTQIIGRLLGGQPLYDQIFAAPFDDPLVQSGVQAARLAITNAGGPGVIIGAPVLTASSSTTSSSSITTYALTDTRTMMGPGVLTMGPGSLTVGAITTCNVGTLPSTTRPTCQDTGTTLVLGNNDTNINVNTDIIYTVAQATVTTETTTNFEQYMLTGIVRRVGSVHGLAPQAAGDSVDMFGTRLRNAGRAPGLWLSGYGWTGERDARGEIPGDKRKAWGMTGGGSVTLAPGLTGGAGFDAGRIRLRLPAVGERAEINLTQFGAHLAWSGGGWFVRGSGSFGYGHANTETAPADIAITASGRNRIRTTSLSAEAGRDFQVGGWTLTPSVGGQWLRVRSGAFTETGNIALEADAASQGFAKGWAGIEAQHEAGPLTVSSYARVTVQDNDPIAIPVRFVGIDVDMTLDGPSLGAVGGEAGLAAGLKLGPNATAFAAYDARLRDGLTLHSGTVGVRVRF